MNLHEKLLELRKYEKKLSVKIIDLLQIMEDKKSYLAMGYSSLFDYLTRGLGYSGSTAYQRQSCIRLSKLSVWKPLYLLGPSAMWPGARGRGTRQFFWHVDRPRN